MYEKSIYWSQKLISIMKFLFFLRLILILIPFVVFYTRLYQKFFQIQRFQVISGTRVSGIITQIFIYEITREITRVIKTRVSSLIKTFQIWYAMFWFDTQTTTKYILKTFRGEESLPDQKQSCISWKIGLKKYCLFFDFVCFSGCHFT